MKNTSRKKIVISVFLIFFLFAVASGLCFFSLNNAGIFLKPAGNSDMYSLKQLGENGSAIDGSIKDKSQDDILKELQK